VSVNEIISLLNSDATWSAVKIGWTVPAGMVVLYFYGRSHFNTPAYSLDLAIGTRSRLITQAPPILTTRRSRYNSYANRYILVLEAAFLGIIFLYSVIEDIARVDKVEIPDLASEPLQYKVVFALFILTGLLSSFPALKQIDVWLLEKFHRAAFIPGDVRDLAAKLYDSTFVPKPNAIAVVRPSLSMRDTGRVADGLASGSLEKRLFELLCLRTQIQTGMAADKFQDFRITLDQDFKAIGDQSQGLKSAVLTYLRSQERIMPSTVTDIDAYISNNMEKDGITELAERRQELQVKSDALYETMCLVIALSLFATQFSPEDIDAAISEMGFTTKVDVIPILDWDAVGMVTISTFVLMLAFNSLFTLGGYLSGLFATVPSLMPDKASIIRFSLLYTLGYAIVMWLAIRLKRKWRRSGAAGDRPENLLIAIFAYFATVPLNITISLYLRHGELTYAPFLYALNQAILGYFIGLYIDRSLRTSLISVKLGLLQGAAQAVGAVIASTLSPSVFSPVVGLEVFYRVEIWIALFSMGQAAISGFLVGILFQYVYKRTDTPIRVADGVNAARIVTAFQTSSPH
jgi:hypothetical protein